MLSRHVVRVSTTQSCVIKGLSVVSKFPKVPANLTRVL